MPTAAQFRVLTGRPDSQSWNRVLSWYASPQLPRKTVIITAYATGQVTPVAIDELGAEDPRWLIDRALPAASGQVRDAAGRSSGHA